MPTLVVPRCRHGDKITQHILSVHPCLGMQSGGRAGHLGGLQKPRNRSGRDGSDGGQAGALGLHPILISQGVWGCPGPPTGASSPRCPSQPTAGTQPGGGGRGRGGAHSERRVLGAPSQASEEAGERQPGSCFPFLARQLELLLGRVGPWVVGGSFLAGRLRETTAPP